MTMKVTIEFRGARKFQRNLRGSREVVLSNMNRMLISIGRVVTPAIRRATPRREGKLARSTRFQVMGRGEDMQLQVRQGARTPTGGFYGHYVREGTRAHEIVPVRASTLRFVMGGRVVFAKRVQHPGTAANPYHTRALRQVRSSIDGILKQAGAKIVRTLASVKGA